MRFTLINNLRDDKAMRLILSSFILFILFYLIADIFVKYYNFGIFNTAIKTTLFGDEQQYIDAITKASFLEFWHSEIFFIMMLLLTLSAIFIRVANRFRLLFTNIVMTSAVVSLLSIALAYFVSPFFIDIYVLSFFIWHISAIYMSIYSMWRLYDKRV